MSAKKTGGHCLPHAREELRDGRENVEQETPGWRRGVYLLVEHHEINPKGLELAHEGNKMMNAPGQPVELSTCHYGDSPPPDRF